MTGWDDDNFRRPWRNQLAELISAEISFWRLSNQHACAFWVSIWVKKQVKLTP